MQNRDAKFMIKRKNQRNFIKIVLFGNFKSFNGIYIKNQKLSYNLIIFFEIMLLIIFSKILSIFLPLRADVSR